MPGKPTDEGVRTLAALRCDTACVKPPPSAGDRIRLIRPLQRVTILNEVTYLEALAVLVEPD